MVRIGETDIEMIAKICNRDPETGDGLTIRGLLKIMSDKLHTRGDQYEGFVFLFAIFGHTPFVNGREVPLDTEIGELEFPVIYMKRTFLTPRKQGSSEQTTSLMRVTCQWCGRDGKDTDGCGRIDCIGATYH